MRRQFANDRVRRAAVASALFVVLAGCAAPQPASQPAQPAATSAPAQKRIITAAMLGEPRSLAPGVGVGGIRGLESIGDLISAGLSAWDDHGRLIPRLGVAVPSTDNGGWKLFPDGTMETTWTLRPGATWHDGVLLTSHDLAFTLTLYRDKKLEFASSLYDAIDGASTPDDRTIVVHWKRPNIEADSLFSGGETVHALPLPAHLLEDSYTTRDPLIPSPSTSSGQALSKDGFMAQDYFTGPAYVGTGPFVVRDWVKGSHVIFDAFPGYILGTPKIDQIVVRFIPDTNALLANILAGQLDMTFGKTLSNEQAVEVRNRWPDGHIDVVQANTISLFPQHLTPNPAVVADPRFLRAVYHATDRQQLADTLLNGLSQITDAMVGPGDVAYPDVQARITRYPYDPRQAMELIQGLGYTRGADGFYHDATGEKLSVELRTVDVDVNTKTQLAIADAWQRAGIGVEPYVVPPAEQTGPARGLRATFKAFEMERGGAELQSLPNYTSANIATPENNYAGQYRTRYKSAELDGLIERYSATIPTAERTRILGDVVAFMSEHLVYMPLFHDVEPTMIGNRIANAAARHTFSSNTWNVHLWDLK